MVEHELWLISRRDNNMSALQIVPKFMFIARFDLNANIAKFILVITGFCWDHCPAIFIEAILAELLT